MRKLQMIAEVVASDSPDPKPAASKRPRRPAWRFSLLGLFGLLSLIAIVLAVCSNVWRVPRVRDRMEITLRVDGVYVDDTPVSFEELHRRLTGFRVQWLEWRERYAGANDAKESAALRSAFCAELPTICLNVESAVPYWQFNDVIAHCLHAALSRFEVRCQAGIFSFVDAAELPLSKGDDWPDLVITGRGDREGRLVRIVGGPFDRSQTPQKVYATARALHVDLLSLAGSNFGPDSGSAMWAIAVECDDNLLFEHVSEMLIAVTTGTKSDGSQTPLFQRVHFLGESERGIGWGGPADSDLTPDLFRHPRSPDVNGQ